MDKTNRVLRLRCSFWFSGDRETVLTTLYSRRRGALDQVLKLAAICPLFSSSGWKKNWKSICTSNFRSIELQGAVNLNLSQYSVVLQIQRWKKLHVKNLEIFFSTMWKFVKSDLIRMKCTAFSYKVQLSLLQPSTKSRKCRIAKWLVPVIWSDLS